MEGGWGGERAYVRIGGDGGDRDVASREGRWFEFACWSCLREPVGPRRWRWRALGGRHKADGHRWGRGWGEFSAAEGMKL